MAISVSPNTISNGLIFAYDMHNTKKSWKGRPTTNKAAGVNLGLGGDRWAVTADYPQKGSLPFELNSNVYKLTSGNNYWAYDSEFGIEYGKTYTISYWYWVNTNEAIQHANYAMGTPSAGGSAYTDVTTTVTNTFTTTANTGGWVYGYKTFTTNVSVSSYSYFRGTYTGTSDTNPTGIGVYVANFMIEESSVPSAYTPTSRSSSQSLVDLTNTYPIGIGGTNGLYYNANNTFRYEGTYYGWTTATLPALSEYAFEFVIKPTGSGDAYPTLFSMNGQNTLTGFIWAYRSGGALIWQYANGTNYLTTNSGSTVLTDSTYSHITVVVSTSGQTVKYYLNGSLTNTATATGIKSIPAGILYIGTYQGATTSSYRLNAEMPLVKVYNTTLTDTQVQQNFNAVRGRYGL